MVLTSASSPNVLRKLRERSKSAKPLSLIVSVRRRASRCTKAARCETSHLVHHLRKFCSASCEGGGDVVGVVTPLVRGGAKVLHGDQIVELSVLLEVHEREEEGEDGEGQIEVESERGELKERRTCTWMT